MDKFFSVFEGKSQNQKILIGLGLSASVFALMAFSFLLTTPQQTNNTNSTKNSGNSNTGQNSNPSSGNFLPPASSLPNTNQTNIPDGWQTSQYRDYQISYPSGFSAQLGTLSGGGVSIALNQKPSTISPSQVNIEMQVYDSKDVPLQRLSDGFTGFGYAKSAVSVAGINAQKFSGSIAATTSASLHTSVVIFENKSRTFKIQLDYLAKEQDNQIESTFNKIVSTFSFILPQ